MLEMRTGEQIRNDVIGYNKGFVLQTWVPAEVLGSLLSPRTWGWNSFPCPTHCAPHTPLTYHTHTTNTLHKASDSRPYVAHCFENPCGVKLVKSPRTSSRLVPQMSAPGGQAIVMLFMEVLQHIRTSLWQVIDLTLKWVLNHCPLDLKSSLSTYSKCTYYYSVPWR